MTLPNVWVRIIVGVTLIPGILLLAWAGGGYLLGFVGLVVVIGLWEYYRIVAAKGLDPNRLLGMVGAISLCWDAWFYAGQAATGIITAAVILVAAIEIVRKRQSSALLNTSTTVFGMLYVGWLSSHLILLRTLPARYPGLTDQDGMGMLLIAFLIPWCCDTAAYFTGRYLGRHALIPRVSAGKTVEGAVGGLIGAVLGLLAVRPFFFGFVTPTDCLLLGCLGGVIAQIGDLAVSLIKRDAEIKDASHIIPGHGGVLDRFDSVLFSAPFVYYYMILVAV